MFINLPLVIQKLEKGSVGKSDIINIKLNPKTKEVKNNNKFIFDLFNKLFSIFLSFYIFTL